MSGKRQRASGHRASMGSTPLVRSVFTQQPPELWYESPIIDGHLNSTTPETVSLQLCASSQAMLVRKALAARTHSVDDVEAALKSAISVLALRFDCQPVEQYDRTRNAMVRCPPLQYNVENAAQFADHAKLSRALTGGSVVSGGGQRRRVSAAAADVHDGVASERDDSDAMSMGRVGVDGAPWTLTLCINRKLPLSTSVSGAPLRLCVAIGDDDVALSHPFDSQSRQSQSGASKVKRPAPIEEVSPETRAHLDRVYAACQRLHSTGRGDVIPPPLPPRARSPTASRGERVPVDRMHAAVSAPRASRLSVATVVVPVEPYPGPAVKAELVVKAEPTVGVKAPVVKSEPTVVVKAEPTVIVKSEAVVKSEPIMAVCAPAGPAGAGAMTPDPFVMTPVFLSQPSSPLAGYGLADYQAGTGFDNSMVTLTDFAYFEMPLEMSQS